MTTYIVSQRYFFEEEPDQFIIRNIYDDKSKAQKRIGELYDKEFDASEETKNTEIYQEMIVMAESVVAGLRVLVEGGVDYNNALQLCSNQIQNRQNLELAKYNCIVNQGQNQI